MSWRRIIVFVVAAGFFDSAFSASCCKTSSSSTSTTNDGGDDQRENLVRGVQALDRLHRFWFRRRMLDALHVEEAPAEATTWRRRRDQQRRSISSAEQNSQTGGGAGGNDPEEQSFRRYTLRVIGIPEAQHSHQHGHRRRHNGGHPRRSNNDDADCSQHYSFYSKIPSTSLSAQPFLIELEKAELELWHTNESLPRLHFRNRPNDAVEAADDQLSSRSSSAAWSMARPRHGGWSPFRLVQGRQGEQENGSFFVSDVTDALRSFWSTTAGANVTISLVRRDDPRGGACLRNSRPQSNRNRRRIEIADDDDSVRPPLVLKLSLVEKSIQRPQQKKRSIGNANFGNARPNNTGGSGRRINRQLIIQDCESQWDSGFLRETSVGQYDDLMPCCRRKVHIDFHELGWGSWVVSPTSFDSFYCMGRCTNFGGFATADTDGAAFYTEAMNLYRDARNSGLTPCCSPVKFSPLTITVLIGDNEEMTQTLEDVVVKQCGCM